MWGVDGPASAVLGSLLSPFPRGGDAEGLTEPPKIDAPPPMGLIISRAASPAALHATLAPLPRRGKEFAPSQVSKPSLPDSKARRSQPAAGL